MKNSQLNITDVTIFPIKPNSQKPFIKAFARIVFNGNFVVSGIKIVKSSNGYSLQFPTINDFTYFAPLETKLRLKIQAKILNSFFKFNHQN